MSSTTGLNEAAVAIVQNCVANANLFRISATETENVLLLDFGVTALGGLEAGLQLSRICMAGLGHISLDAPSDLIALPQVVVRTDHPIAGCLQSQYAGWKVSTDDYFAMGSGPMRATASSESLFDEFPACERSAYCVGVLEAGTLPTQSAIDLLINGLPASAKLTLCIAPTSSQAGNMQVVARSVETAMHKLHELHFPMESVISAMGTAPLPPVAKNDLNGIGRTNDSILYGSTVNLWVNCDDEVAKEFGPRIPSNSSASHGKQFLTLFKEANHDFYAMDKNLFSPAIVILHCLKSGNSFQFGTLVPELLRQSFGM